MGMEESEYKAICCDISILVQWIRRLLINGVLERIINDYKYELILIIVYLNNRFIIQYVIK